MNTTRSALGGRMLFRQTIALVLLLLPLATPSLLAEWKLVGPGKPDISSFFAIDTFLYATTCYSSPKVGRNMTYRSHGDFSQWEPVMLLPENVLPAGYFEDAAGAYHFFFTDHGIYWKYKSDSKWLHTTDTIALNIPGRKYRVWANVFSYQSNYCTQLGDKWYLAMSGIGLAISRDMGRTWSIDNPCLYNSDIYGGNNYPSADTCLQSLRHISSTIIKADDSNLFLGTSTGLVRFAKTMNDFSEPSTQNLAINNLCTDVDGRIFASTNDIKLYVSDDRGKSWDQISEGYPKTSWNKPLSGSKTLLPMVCHNNRIYFANSGGVFTISGNKIVESANGWPVNTPCYQLISKNGVLFALAPYEIYRLIGQQWQKIDFDREGAYGGATAMTFYKNELWVGKWSGVYSTPDYGLTWTNRNTGSEENFGVISLIASRWGLYCATVSDGIYRWDQNASKWVHNNSALLQISSTVPTDYPQYNWGGKFVETPNSIFINGMWSGGLWKLFPQSDVWGQTTNEYGYGSAISWSNDTGFAARYDGPLYRTVNGGVSWTVARNLENVPCDVFQHGKVVLLAVTSSGNFFYRSLDAGASWDSIATNSGFSYGPKFAWQDGIYYALAGDALYISADSAVSWRKISDLAPNSADWLQPFMVHGDCVAYGTNEGLWINSLAALGLQTSTKHESFAHTVPNHYGLVNGRLTVSLSSVHTVRVECFNAIGQLIVSQSLGKLGAGEHTLSLNRTHHGLALTRLFIDGKVAGGFKSTVLR